MNQASLTTPPTSSFEVLEEIRQPNWQSMPAEKKVIGNIFLGVDNFLFYLSLKKTSFFQIGLFNSEFNS